MQLRSWGSVKLIFRPGFKTKQSPSLLQLIVCVVETCRVLLEVLRATQSAHTPLLEVQSPHAISLIGLYHLTFWEWRANIVSWMLDATSKFWGDTGNFAPVCSTCASFQGKQESQSSYQSVSKHKRSHACRSRGCFQQCACFEEEFLSLNFSIKEALPLVPTSQQVEVMKVIEATQTFCPDCVGPALNYSTSRTDANISGPKFFPLEFEEEEQVQSPGDGTVADSISFSSQFTRTVPSQCKSRRTRRRRQRTKRHALSSDTALGLWRRVEILLPNCSRDALEKTVLQLEETVPESQVESLPRLGGLWINSLILSLRTPRWAREPSKLRSRMLFIA